MRPLLIITTLLASWLALAAAAMLPGSIQTAMIPATTKTIPPGIAIIDKRGPLLIIYSEDPNYVTKLYKSGTKLVLPARKKTCLTLQNV